MNQVGDSRDSMLTCQVLPSIVPYFGIQSGGIDPLLNLLDCLTLSGTTSRLVPFVCHVVVPYPHCGLIPVAIISLKQKKKGKERRRLTFRPSFCNNKNTRLGGINVEEKY